MKGKCPGHSAHPHRGSAGPSCCCAGVSGPAMRHGGGSKLKGLMGRAPYPHADAAFRSIGCPACADGADRIRPCAWDASPIR